MVRRSDRAAGGWRVAMAALALGACGRASSGHYAQPTVASTPDAPARSSGGEAYSAAYHDYWSPSYPYAHPATGPTAPYDAMGGGPRPRHGSKD